MFVTAYDKYAVAAFEQGAVDYVMKPFSAARLATTVARLKASCASARPTSTASCRRSPRPRRARSTCAGSPRRRATTCGSSPSTRSATSSADNKYTMVVTAEQESLIRRPIKELVDELDPDMFWQIHRGTLVNVNAIAGVTRDFRGQAAREAQAAQRDAAGQRVRTCTCSSRCDGVACTDFPRPDACAARAVLRDRPVHRPARADNVVGFLLGKTWIDKGLAPLRSFCIALLVFTPVLLAVVAVENRGPRAGAARIGWLAVALLVGHAIGGGPVVSRDADPLSPEDLPPSGRSRGSPRCSCGSTVAGACGISSTASPPWCMYDFLKQGNAAAAAMHREELRREDMQRDNAEARLQVMQAQIEPHFLFNTLASVRALYQTDRASGRQMLQHLSRYLTHRSRHARVEFHA